MHIDSNINYRNYMIVAKDDDLRRIYITTHNYKEGSLNFENNKKIFNEYIKYATLNSYRIIQLNKYPIQTQNDTKTSKHI